MAGFVELSKLSKSFDSQAEAAVIVEDFNLSIERGEFICLLGNSGCGKSTVLRMISGQVPVSSGRVAIADREISGPGPDRGVVLYSPCLMPWMSVFENVMLGVKEVYPQGTKQDCDNIVANYLKLVGLDNFMHQPAGNLSQCLQQRVGIARAFALNPQVLLLDDPFGVLDSESRRELQEVFQELLNCERLTTLMISQDVDEALFMSDKVVLMTNSPHSKVGAVIDVPFQRPRNRSEVMKHPEYAALKKRINSFLNNQCKNAFPAPGGQTPSLPSDLNDEAVA